MESNLNAVHKARLRSEIWLRQEAKLTVVLSSEPLFMKPDMRSACLGLS